MAKTEEEKLSERLAEVQKLLSQRSVIDERLKILMGVKQEEKKPTVPKPDGFSLMKEIGEALKTGGGPMTAPALTASISKKWNIELEVKNVRATAKYMVGRGQLTVGEDKAFSLKT